ncbi:hypothetical protein QYE76_010071 [Lolium multiflorum]|uniref:Uncharacterized protein n=1 Tax=Lolium multiflorum TaxID=4521 RepID=A0AAD8TW80_LOLMU|nr:hypothetical protein QYE76_010071 [Lolium multiflorum]
MHLLRQGFMPSYNCWTKHGERGVIMEEDEEGDDFIDENYLDHFGDTFMEDAEGGEGEGEGEEEARDEPADDLGRTIADARRGCETKKERKNLDRIGIAIPPQLLGECPVTPIDEEKPACWLSDKKGIHPLLLAGEIRYSGQMAAPKRSTSRDREGPGTLPR